jgi:hypothetical protein
MANANDFEEKAREAEALAASSRRPAFRSAFEKLAQDYRALAQKQKELSASQSPPQR